MSESFSRWLQESFLAAPNRIAPKADGPPAPYCSGNKDKCFKHLLDLLDGQLELDSELRLQANIEACKACYEELDLQLAIREALKFKIREAPVPLGLIEEIKGKITLIA
jgi:anti-sigma factor (TIGR02949 family)